MTALPVGTAEVRREGGGPLLLAVGAMVPVAESIAKELDATVVNLRFVKPLDEELIVRLARQHDTVVTRHLAEEERRKHVRQLHLVGVLEVTLGEVEVLRHHGERDRLHQTYTVVDLRGPAAWRQGPHRNAHPRRRRRT